MTSVFFIFKRSFSLMSFGCSIAFSSGGMILWGRSACSPLIATSALLRLFCCGFLSFSISLDTSFLSWCISCRVIHAPLMFFQCLLFSLSPSVDHKFFVLLAGFLDVEFSFVGFLAFVECYWNNSGWYLCYTALSILFAVLDYCCCCWHWVANHFLAI